MTVANTLSNRSSQSGSAFAAFFGLARVSSAFALQSLGLTLADALTASFIPLRINLRQTMQQILAG